MNKEFKYEITGNKLGSTEVHVKTLSEQRQKLQLQNEEWQKIDLNGVGSVNLIL